MAPRGAGAWAMLGAHCCVGRTVPGGGAGLRGAPLCRLRAARWDRTNTPRAPPGLRAPRSASGPLDAACLGPATGPAPRPAPTPPQPPIHPLTPTRKGGCGAMEWRSPLEQRRAARFGRSRSGCFLFSFPRVAVDSDGDFHSPPGNPSRRNLACSTSRLIAGHGQSDCFLIDCMLFL